MTYLTKALLIAAALFVASPAQAQFRSGNKLYNDCVDSSASERLFCLGYIAGVHDQMTGSMDKNKDCSPTNYSMGQMRDMTIQVLVNKPELRHLPGNYFVMSAFWNAWGCK